MSSSVLPLFLIIALGFVLGRWRPFDVNTLSSILLYVATPATLFLQLYEAELDPSLLSVFAFTLLYPAGCGLVAYCAARLFPSARGETTVLVSQQMYINEGNFGLPLLMLVFSGAYYTGAGGNPYLAPVITAHTIVMCVQGVLPNTLGLVMLTDERPTLRAVLARITRLPVLYVAPAALLAKLIPMDLSGCFFWPSLEYLRSIMIGLSLLTIGIQFASQKMRLPDGKVLLSIFLRFIVGPCIAFPIIRLLGLGGAVAQALFIGSAVPTALTVLFLCIECKRNAEYSSQVILYSMLLCPFMLTFVVSLARRLFPL